MDLCSFLPSSFTDRLPRICHGSSLDIWGAPKAVHLVHDLGRPKVTCFGGPKRESRAN